MPKWLRWYLARIIIFFWRYGQWFRRLFKGTSGRASINPFMEMVGFRNEDMFPSNFFYQPWIIYYCHGANKHTTTFIDPMKIKIHEKEIEEMKGKLCFGCIDEWLLIWDEQKKECFFLHLKSLSKIFLPPLPNENIIFTSFSVSTSLDHPECTVIFRGTIFETEEHFLMYCMLNDEKWNKLDLYHEFAAGNDVILEEELYISIGEYLLVFDLPSLQAGWMVYKDIIELPMPIEYPRSDKVCIHLVESCGWIYLVRLYGYGGGPIINMDIYRLDTFSNKWQRVDGIGEHAFLLSNTRDISVCAKDVGLESNCIYVPINGEEELRIYKFCLDDHTVAFTLTPLIEEIEYESTFFWFVPTRQQKIIMESSVLPTDVLNEVCEDKIVVEKKVTSNVSRPWNDLTVDLLELLISHLTLVDSLRLFTVCKEWNLASDSIQKAQTRPWLMYQEKSDCTCKLLDPLSGKEYTTKVTLPSFLCPTQMLCSKDGWVIVLYGGNRILMVNPLNEDVVELPFLKRYHKNFCGITFTSVPTSPDCVVLAFYTKAIFDDNIHFYKWHSGEEDWTIIKHNESPFNAAAITNPVFFQGELYCLGESGELGVLNPVEETWRVLDKPKSVYLEDEAPFRGTQDCYLLELGGDLVSVFKYNYSDYHISIFKLDRENMEWVPVKDLIGWTLFLDPRSSFAKPSLHKRWSNKILFTSFQSGTTKTCVSYCMKSKRYDAHFCDTKKPFDCVWFEPTLIKQCLADIPC